MRATAEIEEQNARVLKSVRGTISRDSIVVAIATGSITRERSCDGKKGFRTPQFAETVRQRMAERYRVDFHYYHCGFCLCYHVATGPA